MGTFDKTDELHLRNLVFGVEDGIVSTVGLLSGIAIASVPRSTILLTGVVLIFVEAISMAAGSFLSEASVDDLSEESSPKASVSAGAIMFASYFAAGFVPLMPYLFLEVGQAFAVSVLASLLTLFALGYWSGRGSRKPMKKALRMMLVGGAAIVVGILAGSLLA